MLSWLFDVATWTTGLLCAVVFGYGVLLQSPKRPDPRFSRLDRRNAEGRDRRKTNFGGPNGIERRLGPRRLSEGL